MLNEKHVKLLQLLSSYFIVREAINECRLRSRMDDKEQTLIESQVRDRLSVDGPDQRTRLDLGLIFVII